MRNFRKLTAGLTAICLVGCAKTPPITTHYYLAKSSLQVRVVRTLGCDESNSPVVASTVTPTVYHSADLKEPREIALWRADSAFANSEFKTEFTGDGRLKAVNANTTGQGETIFKAAIKLAGTFAADSPRAPIEEKCKHFRLAFKDKVLTVIYELRDDLMVDRRRLPIPADSQSEYYAGEYRLLLGDTCLHLTQDGEPIAPVSYGASKNDVVFRARQPGLVSASVTTGPMGNCGASTIWSSVIQVAQRGKEYDLRIPRAALFGKQQFGVTFDESGSLSSVQYNKDSGAAGLLNTVQAGVDEFHTTAAEEAAALKSEADVIAAQQRLIRCKTDPSKCS
jgi:hypothetical protein